MKASKHGKRLLALVTLGTLGVMAMMSGCGQGGDGELSQIKAGPPDLRFSGIPVQMYVPGAAAPVDVLNGGTFKVPCNTPGFRARYRYENVGQSPAAAHSNASQVTGSGTYAFAQAAMGAGTLRYAFASFGAVAAPNIETKLSIRLDAPGVGAVWEADEANNVWVAKVIRSCP